MWAKSSIRYVRAWAHAAEAGGAAVRTLTRGPPRAASRRGCRPCALAACGPRRPTPARRPPRPSFYRVVSRAAGATARRGARCADAGHRAAAAGPSLAATTLPIVGGGRRALPAALGPGGGAACARPGERAAAAPPPPPPGRGRSPAGRAPAAASSPALQLGLRFLSSLHFVSPAAHGRLMEGRIHGPLYPARPVSWAPAHVCDRFRRGAFFLLASRFLKPASVWARLQQVV